MIVKTHFALAHIANAAVEFDITAQQRLLDSDSSDFLLM
jgi:hypothetical protein